VLDRGSLDKIAAAVVGAMAASVHGVVRASLDAGVVISLPIHALPEVERDLRDAGFRTELRVGDADDPIAAVLALSDEFGNRVDLLTDLRGLETAAFSRAMEIAFQGERLRVIGREDFIAMKLFAHGPRDILDAELALAAARQRGRFAVARAPRPWREVAGLVSVLGAAVRPIRAGSVPTGYRAQKPLIRGKYREEAITHGPVRLRY
jgi:hypothetical protein